MKLLPVLFWSAFSFVISCAVAEKPYFNPDNQVEGKYYHPSDPYYHPTDPYSNWDYANGVANAGSRAEHEERVKQQKREHEREQEEAYRYSMIHAFLAGDGHKRDDSKARHDKDEYYKGREKRQHQINEMRIQSDKKKKSASFKVIPSFIVSVIVVIALCFANC